MRTPEADRKILSVSELAAERGRLREEGKTVVQCHGCFDIVHPGHIRYLRPRLFAASTSFCRFSTGTVSNP